MENELIVVEEIDAIAYWRHELFPPTPQVDEHKKEGEG